LLRPNTKITDKSIIQSPIINAPTKITETERTVTIEHPNSKAVLYYTIDGTEPNANSKIYKSPFYCDSSTIVSAKAFLNQQSSTTSTARLFKKPNNWGLQIKSNYTKQYDAGGDEGIIDGQHGTVNWRSGGWQGYQSQNFECTIDLKKTTTIQTISANFLQDTRSWIIYPKEVEFLSSIDGINYSSVGKIKNSVPADDYTSQVHAFTYIQDTQLAARYIKIIATNYGKLPDWHQGKSGDAYLFIDEIEIK
jgi:hypothetical protein